MQNQSVLILCLFLLIFSALTSVTPKKTQAQNQDTVVAYYVRIGLESNLALRQKKLNYEKSFYALKEAKAWFYPEISFQARYSIAHGGRAFDLPVGDLLNPVYQNLNQLNDQVFNSLPPQMQPPDYPTIGNEEIQFLRPTEHETKLVLQQPLINNDISYQKRIRQLQMNISEFSQEAYKKELVTEIKSAYYNYMKAIHLMEVVDYSEKLLLESLRVNQKLFEQQKVTKYNVYKAESELGKLYQKKAETEKQIQVAAAYLNFLLNRPLDAPLQKWTPGHVSFKFVASDSLYNYALENREEIRQLKSYDQILGYQIDIVKNNRWPDLALWFEYGFQGEEYNFTDEYDYFLGAVLLKWNLFHAAENKHKTMQRMLEKEQNLLTIDETEKNISLQLMQSIYTLKAAWKSVLAAEKQLKSAQEAYKIVKKQYEAGQINMLLYIDAHNSLIFAEDNLIITKYDFLIKRTEFEKNASLININHE